MLIRRCQRPLSTTFLRPIFLTPLLLGLILLSPPGLKSVQAEGLGAMAQIQQAIQEVMQTVSNPAMAGEEHRQARMERLKEIVYSQFHLQAMAIKSVGDSWRRFTPEQGARFIEIFKRVLEEAYLNKIDSFVGIEMTFLEETPLGSRGNQAQVLSQVVYQGSPHKITYWALKGSDGMWRVYDVAFGSIRMSATFRPEYEAGIQRLGVEGFLEQMEAKFMPQPEATPSQPDTTPSTAQGTPSSESGPSTM